MLGDCDVHVLSNGFERLFTAAYRACQMVQTRGVDGAGGWLNTSYAQQGWVNNVMHLQIQRKYAGE